MLLNEPRVIAEPLKIGNYIQLIQRSAMEGVAVVERLREFQSDDDGVREPADVFSNEPSQGAAQTEELPAEGAQSLRILVVDDEPLVREVIAIYLGDDNHVITTACNGREGLEVFQSATFDIVLTDRAMPEMNGEQLAIEIKRLKPDQPVILLTGFGESAGEEPPGVDLIVSKPFTINTLRGAIFKSLAP